MNENELQAMVSLLDDPDMEISRHIEQKLLSLGTEVVPFLETQWALQGDNEPLQQRIEQIVHQIQYQSVQHRLRQWVLGGGNDLLEGMWIVSTYMYPGVRLEPLRQQFNEFFYDMWREFGGDMTAFEQVKLFNQIFFGKFGFRANTDDFHSPTNSLINIVLERKSGNPISLCIIYMLIAQKLKMPVYGVNLPNVFVLTYKSPDIQFYINAFNKGITFSRSDIDNYIAQLNFEANDSFYEPCTHIDIMRRVLRNLAISFEKLEQFDKSEEIKQLLELLHVQ